MLHQSSRVSAIIIYAAILTVVVNAECLSDSDCSNHGSCNADRKSCYCDYFWLGANCNVPLAVLAKTSVYKFYRWGGLAWYVFAAGVLIFCIYRVQKGKALSCICLVPRGNHPQHFRRFRETDPQQVPLLCVCAHCIFSLVQFATDPLSVRDPRPGAVFFQWMLWYADSISLMMAAFFMVRFWVKVRAAFSQIDTKALRWFDRSVSVLVVLSIIFAICRTSTQLAVSSRPGLAGTSHDVGIGFVVVMGLHFLLVTAFALIYGISLLHYLQDKHSGDRRAVAALRRLTLLLLTMVTAVALEAVLYIINLNTEFENGSAINMIPFNIGIRSCSAIFIISLPVAIGNVDKDQMAAQVYRKTPTTINHLESRRSQNPRSSALRSTMEMTMMGHDGRALHPHPDGIEDLAEETEDGSQDEKGKEERGNTNNGRGSIKGPSPGIPIVIVDENNNSQHSGNVSDRHATFSESVSAAVGLTVVLNPSDKPRTSTSQQQGSQQEDPQLANQGELSQQEHQLHAHLTAGKGSSRSATEMEVVVGKLTPSGTPTITTSVSGEREVEPLRLSGDQGTLLQLANSHDNNDNNDSNDSNRNQEKVLSFQNWSQRMESEGENHGRSGEAERSNQMRE